MSNPTVYRLLNDLSVLSTAMREKDPAYVAEWHRVGMDARALLRLVIDDVPASLGGPSRRPVSSATA
jgi:hypothetical protein